MSLKIVVLAKQVPDTRNVGKDAMKEDGTINRAALPAIFNPEDLNALEQALQLKDLPISSRNVITRAFSSSFDSSNSCSSSARNNFSISVASSAVMDPCSTSLFT